MVLGGGANSTDHHWPHHSNTTPCKAKVFLNHSALRYNYDPPPHTLSLKASYFLTLIHSIAQTHTATPRHTIGEVDHISGVGVVLLSITWKKTPPLLMCVVLPSRDPAGALLNNKHYISLKRDSSKFILFKLETIVLYLAQYDIIRIVYHSNTT